MLKRLIYSTILFFFPHFILANEVVSIKTYDRDDYIRVVFELTNKPSYFVDQNGEEIDVFLPDTTVKTTLYKNINKLEVIDDIKFVNEKNNTKFIIVVKNNATMKRYLYTEPTEISKFYRVIVDVYKKEQKFDNLDNVILSYLAKENLLEEKPKKDNSIDDLINNIEVDNTDNFKTLNDIIGENIRPQDINELLELNNITDEEITKNIENQNNEKVNLDDFLKKISINIDKLPEITNKSKNTQTTKSPKKTQIKKYTVVVDAGHGGKDPGAIGLFKSKEKNINLAVAKAIKYELSKNPKLNVYMTRNDDRFIELFDRVNRSRVLEADLFISIHSDSNPNRRARGLSVYTLKKSASDVRTTALFNDKVLKNFSNKKQETISAILDINRYENLNKSVRFSEKLIQNFKKQKVNLLNDPHKYGNFAVLLAPEYPSVLIELGFISNPYDEKMLQTYDFRKKVSLAVSGAVKSYFGI